ncbi:MAG: hypothetical protein ACI9C1_000317 [Candidatus Aldehydirespiratoraceae bacterium]|jgi:hypothetical protein
MNDDEKVLSGEAWAEFCDQLKAAGELVQTRSEDDLDKAEGYRYLTRLLRGGLSSYFETGDSKFPVIRPMPYQLKIGSDNPDSNYMTTPIDGRLNYRITGHRGTVHYLSISAFAGNYGAGQDRLGLMGFIDGNDLLVDDDGQVEIFVGPTPHDHNWVSTRPEPGSLGIRQFFLDRTTETEADLHIECLDHDESPKNLTPEGLGKQLAGASMFVAGCSEIFTGWVDDLMEESCNAFTTKAAPMGGAWGDPNQIFRHGGFRLAEGEALIIEFTPPECFYWNFQVNNRWMESLDYRWLPVTINKHTVRLEDDGSVQLVLAHRDPGFGTWMTTHGHTHGTIGLRWNQAEEDVEPTIRLVNLDDAPS